MKIVIHDLYHTDNGYKAYFHKQGEACFDFTFDEKYASNLTEEEANRIMNSSDWYCNIYGASHMTIEV